MHLDALTELWRNKDVVICRPDKGAGIVLLHKEDYESKLISILSDQANFTLTLGEKDKTEDVEQQIPFAWRHSEVDEW